VERCARPAFLKSGVPHIDLPQDGAFFATAPNTSFRDYTSQRHLFDLGARVMSRFRLDERVGTR